MIVESRFSPANPALFVEELLDIPLEGQEFK
jgi:hypothetical protein